MNNKYFENELQNNRKSIVQSICEESSFNFINGELKASTSSLLIDSDENELKIDEEYIGPTKLTNFDEGILTEYSLQEYICSLEVNEIDLDYTQNYRNMHKNS